MKTGTIRPRGSDAVQPGPFIRGRSASGPELRLRRRCSTPSAPLWEWDCPPGGQAAHRRGGTGRRRSQERRGATATDAAKFAAIACHSPSWEMEKPEEPGETDD